MRRICAFLVIVSTSLEAQAQGFLWAPLEGPLTITCDFCGYTFGSGDCHGGIDFRAQTPRSVYAAAEGMVALVDNAYQDNVRIKKSYGNRVVLVHPNGYRTVYAHLTQNSIMVVAGSSVVVGQEIALTDNSGDSTGPHLHFEVRNPQGQRVDPYGDPTDQAQCIPEDQNIPHTCGPNTLWTTCPPQVWEPCFGVVCNSPPTPFCIDEETLRSYVSQGSCSQGECAYQFIDVGCSYGCANDVCLGNPCANIVCYSPPLPYCVNAATLRTYTAPGTCANGACTYPYFETNCSEGCANGACLQNPCTGVVCENPPPAYCLNSTTLRTHASVGQCVNGSCEYAAVDANCVDASSCTTDQCINSACVHLVTLDSDGDGFIAGWCMGGNDCDDDNPLIHPNAQEVCNGEDDDCNDSIDESFGCCPTTPCGVNQLCCDGVCQTGACCYPNGYCDLGWDGNENVFVVCSSFNTCAYCTSDSQCNDSAYPFGGFPRVCCGGYCYSGDCCSDADCQTYWTEYVCGNQWSDHICQLP